MELDNETNTNLRHLQQSYHTRRRTESIAAAECRLIAAND
jgi:hypothetical protein